MKGPIWGVKFGGQIWLTAEYTEAIKKAREFGTIFDGKTPATMAERVDKTLLPTLKDDGYTLHWQCQKCSAYAPRVYGVDGNDFITSSHERMHRYICGECVR